jgi:hypothetical protein
VVTLDRPVLTWRAFEARSGRLYSLTAGRNSRWGSGVKTARCGQPAPKGKEHQAPGRDCDCGIYGVSSLALARRAAKYTLQWPWHPIRWNRVVYGLVLLWGGDFDPVAFDAVQGGIQARAPFGQVMALVQSPRSALVAERLGLRLIGSVGVVEDRYLQAYAEDLADFLDAVPLTEQLFQRVAEPTAGELAWREVSQASRAIASWFGGVARDAAPPVLRGVRWGVRWGLGLLWRALQSAWPLGRTLLRWRLTWTLFVLGGGTAAVRIVPPGQLELLGRAALEALNLLVAGLAIAVALLLVLAIPLAILRPCLRLFGVWPR